MISSKGIMQCSYLPVRMGSVTPLATSLFRWMPSQASSLVHRKSSLALMGSVLVKSRW